MSETTNRREYLRLQSDASLLIERLNPEELSALEEGFDEQRLQFGISGHLLYGSQRFLPQMRIIERRQPEVAAYLKLLERQIGALATRLVEKENLIDTTVRQSVNLSASGAQFISDDYFQPGEHLKLAMTLYPQWMSFLSIAQVQRVEPKAPLSEGQGEQWSISVRFSRLHEEDQEILIKHLYQQQVEAMKREYE